MASLGGKVLSIDETKRSALICTSAAGLTGAEVALAKISKTLASNDKIGRALLC